VARKTRPRKAARNARKAGASGGPDRRTSVRRGEAPERPTALAQRPGGEVPTSQKIRVLVVDDHPIVRQGLVKIIEQEPDLEVCCEAEDVRGALDSVARSKPDMAIVDISLKQSSGLELIKLLKARLPRLPVLALSMHDENLFAVRVLKAGAAGYVMKREASEILLTAIRRVLGGDIHVSERVASEIVRGFTGGRSREAASSVELLSDRELEVFQLIGEGIATSQVAQALHLSVKTIETHRQHIKEKLGLKNATELVCHAVNWVQGAGAYGRTAGPSPLNGPG
jgi:DNA-binding NarL/FixJ family response regulator